MLFLMLEENPYEEAFLYPHSHLCIYLSFMVYLFASVKSYPNISSEKVISYFFKKFTAPNLNLSSMSDDFLFMSFSIMDLGL